MAASWIEHGLPGELVTRHHLERWRMLAQDMAGRICSATMDRAVGWTPRAPHRASTCSRSSMTGPSRKPPFRGRSAIT